MEKGMIFINIHVQNQSKEKVFQWSATWWECGNVNVGAGVSGGFNPGMILSSLLLLMTTTNHICLISLSTIQRNGSYKTT